jgi:hypothetical protein
MSETTEQLREPEKQTPKPEIMAVDDNKVLSPTTASELSSYLSLMAQGGAFPEAFDNQAKKLAAYNLARSLMGKNWQLAINNIAAIKGKLTIYGDLPRAIAEQTGQVEEFRLYTIDSDYQEMVKENKNLDAEVFAAVCEVKRKGRAAKQYAYTIQDATKAGQLPASRADSPWNKHKKIMLMRKAMNLGVKFEFPDALLGCPIAEYDYDIAPDLEKDVTPPSLADTLNKRFGGLRE